jgi:hypothetical protein
MSGKTLALAIVVVGFVCLLIGVYYLIPGPTKLFVSDAPTGQHIKHALVFFALGIVAFVASRFAASATQTN